MSRVLTVTVLCVSSSVLSLAACTHTTDRVIEPAGSADASTNTPEVSDAGLNPLGPIAHPVEPADDYRLVRGNEFGSAREVAYVPSAEQAPGLGGAGGMPGGGGIAGSDRRPVVAAAELSAVSAR